MRNEPRARRRREPLRRREGHRGRIALGSEVGLTFVGVSGDAGDGTDDATMRFRGTQSAIAAALPTLSFVPEEGYEGDARLRIVANDLGNTGHGGALESMHVVRLVVPLNDPPTIAAPEHVFVPQVEPFGFLEDGWFAYRPEPGFTGEDSFTIRVSDGLPRYEAGDAQPVFGQDPTSRVAVQVTNSLPTAQPDSYVVLHDSGTGCPRARRWSSR